MAARSEVTVHRAGRSTTPGRLARRRHRRSRLRLDRRQSTTPLDADGAGTTAAPSQNVARASRRHRTPRWRRGSSRANWTRPAAPPPASSCCCAAACSSSPTATPGRKAATSLRISTRPSPATTARRPASSPSSPPCSPTTCSAPPRRQGPAHRHLLKASRDNAAGVDSDLREGLQRSVEIIANEVLARLERRRSVDPRPIEDLKKGPFARELTRESLRYLYRILFLLYAEARPELGILPADDGSYEAGYSMARLRELVERDEKLVEEEAETASTSTPPSTCCSTRSTTATARTAPRPTTTSPATTRRPAGRRRPQRGPRPALRAAAQRAVRPEAISLIGSGVLDPRCGRGRRASTVAGPAAAQRGPARSAAPAHHEEGTDGAPRAASSPTATSASTSSAPSTRA